MASLNKVLLVGHLGRDPDVRVTAQGAPICNLSLATSERFKDKTGESREVTEWHRVVLYRRLAEVARDHLKKGDLVVSGNRAAFLPTSSAGGDRIEADWPRSVASTALG